MCWLSNALLWKSHPSGGSTWAALTDGMPLACPWAVNSWSTGSHIINTNKTLSSWLQSSLKLSGRPSAGGSGLNGLRPRPGLHADPWSLRIDTIRGRFLPGRSRGQVSWWRLGRKRWGGPPLFPGHSPHRNLGTETHSPSAITQTWHAETYTFIYFVTPTTLDRKLVSQNYNYFFDCSFRKIT